MGACPVCGKIARPRAENPAVPFCSPRCKQVDLGNWLNETYRVPASDESVNAEGEAQAAPGAGADTGNKEVG